MGKLNIDYRLNDKITFTLSGNYGGGDFTTKNEQTSSYFNNEGIKDKGALRTTLSKNNFRFGHVNPDYNHDFKKKEKTYFFLNLEEYNAPTSGKNPYDNAHVYRAYIAIVPDIDIETTHLDMKSGNLTY